MIQAGDPSDKRRATSIPTSADWVDCIAGQESTGGNMTADPLFCEPAFYDLYLCADSPSLPAFNDCELLFGAFDEGCPACGTPVNPASWGVIKPMYK